MPSEADEVLDFWFGREDEPGYGEFRDAWFRKDEGFDEEVRERFGTLYERAASGELDGWRDDARSCLALVICLDQFPRNMFRGRRETYRTDPVALMAADRAIERGFDHKVDPAFRRFFYLPFMHSESLRLQERSVALNEALGDEDSIKWARHHHDIVARFGRFPHRNAILGRETTPEEARFLEESEFRG